MRNIFHGNGYETNQLLPESMDDLIDWDLIDQQHLKEFNKIYYNPLSDEPTSHF